MTSLELANGEIIDGKYIVQRRVGAGAMGEIYLALQRPFMRRVALKVLHPWLGDSEDMSRRFMQEAEALARLNHPNTVTVIDFGRFESRHFIAMEFIEGMTVGENVRVNGPMAPEDAIPLAIQVAQSLSEAHAKGIIHRDLKTDNILLSTPPGVAPFVKVVDFGIAKILDRRDETLNGNIVGTPHYMAPEQARDGAIGPAADIYSLGCCLFEMLTGQPPFGGLTPMEVMIRHQTDAPPGLPPAFPKSLDEFITRTLAKDPNDRPVDARTFIAELLECSTRSDEWRINAQVKTTLDAEMAPTIQTPTNPVSPASFAPETPAIPAPSISPDPAPPATYASPRALWLATIGGVIFLAGMIAYGARDTSMQIDSAPTGALLEVDGELLGVTPLEIPIDRSATIRGRLIKRGYLPTTFESDGEGPRKLFIALEEQVVTALVRAPVDGMHVSVNGTYFGQFNSGQRTLRIAWPEDGLRVVMQHPAYADYIEVIPEPMIAPELTIAPSVNLLTPRKDHAAVPLN